MRILLLFIIVNTTLAFGQEFTDSRNKQLDSIVTNIDRNILKNLDSVHTYLHNKGNNDTERVFLFYGLIGIHYKYDYERKRKGKKAKEYTPYYTCKRRSGVCRDFAALFKDLCDRSDIPCVVATGRTNVPVWTGVADFFKGRLKETNHAWNVVKYNNEWHLMDPTWSQVYKVEKYYTYDDTGRRKYAGKAKRNTRNYFDTDPEVFYENRSAAHPAYYISDTVYSFKTVRRRERRRRVEFTGYDYEPVLDSLSSSQRYKFSNEFFEASHTYSKNAELWYFLKYELDYVQLKRTKFDPLTVESCKKHMKEIEQLIAFVENDHGINMQRQFRSHRTEVITYKNKLIRRSVTR